MRGRLAGGIARARPAILTRGQPGIDDMATQEQQPFDLGGTPEQQSLRLLGLVQPTTN